MASKATEKYTAIYLNSAKKHNAQPIYEKQSVAPDRGNLVQVSGSDIDNYSKTTQKYIKDYSNQSVASFNPAEAARLRQEAVQRMMSNFIRDTNAGKKAYNEVSALLQNNQARRAAENSLRQKLASLPPAEISSGNRTNAATEALAKANNIRNGLSYGLARGLGYNSLVNAAGAAYERITGEEQPSLREFNEATQRAQRTAPNAFSAGNVAGNIALMSSVGGVANAGMNAAGATGLAGRLGANALTFGGTEAIHGLGDVAQGNITPGRYAKNIGASALGGAVGGEASNLVGSRMADVLMKKGMMTPFMEFVRQTAAGTAFGAGNLAATQAVAYGTNDDDMKLDRRQAAEQLLTTFGFSMINGAIRTLGTTAAAKSALQNQVDQATAVYQDLMNGSFTEDEYIQRINTLMEYTDSLRNSINSQYLAGNQNAVNNMNDALDVIQESLRGRLAGIDAARAAGNVGNNVLVDNINPGVDTTGMAPPSTEPQPPSTYPTVDQLNEEAGSPFAIYDAAKAPGTYLDQEVAAAVASGAYDNVPAPEVPVEDQLRQLAQSSLDQKESQRQALYDAGKNHEQNIQPLMDSATMLTEEEKLAALRQGNQDATDAEIKDAMSAPGSAVQPISDADINEYVKAGTKKNVHKRNAVAAGKDIILRTATEAKKYISNAIHGNGLETVAFGKVGQRLIDDANKYTGGKIDLKGMFLELIPNNIKHAYQQHLTAKYDNNIDLTEQDFLNIPRYIAEYDDFIEAVEYKNDREIKLGKRLDNGGVVIIQAVSNNRGALQFKNMWGLTNEGYEEYIKNRSSQVSQEAFLSASSTGYDGASSTNIIPSEVQTVKENLNVRAEQTGADSLRGRSIRVLSQRAGEQAGGIQPAAGGAGEEGQARTYADPEAEVLRIGEAIKGETVVRTAVPGQIVYTVEGDTKATRKAKAVAASVGAKATTLYASGDDGLKVKSGDRVLTSRGTCDPSTEKFSACVNDPKVDAAQIIQHEAVELGVARGTVNPQEIYDSIKATDDLVSSAIDGLVEMYVQYGSEPMDTAHALKELFCDAGGGINQFKDVEGWEDVAATMDAVSAYIRPMLNEALGGALDAEPEAPEASADTSDPITAYSEQNNSKAVQYSIDQFAQANGFQLVRNSEGVPYSIMDPATGKEVRPRDITPERVKNTPQGRMIAAAEKTGAIDAKTADAQRRFTADVMKLCAQYKDQATVWEIAGATAFSSFKANSDSQYGSTVDFGTICSKTQAIVDVMSNTMVEKGRGLKRDEVLKVYDAVAHTGLSVPCPVCYVFSRWIGVPSLLETMRKGQERFGENTTVEAVNGYIHNMETKYHGKDGINNTKVKVQNKVQKLQQELLKARGNDAEIGRIAKETKAVEKELADLEIYNWVTQVRCKTDSKRNPIRDSKGRVALDPKYKSVPNDVLLNLNRTGEFARDYPKSWLYRTTRGAGMGKAILPYSGAGLGDAVRGAGIAKPTLYGKGQNPFFNGDDKKASRDLTNAQKRMRAQNLIGGQRLQSTSDFRAEWGLDYVTDLMEMQNVGAKGQLYTKVIEAVDLLATAGNEVNLSIMGKGNGYHKDSNGRPVLGVEDFSSVTGIDFKAAYEKVKKYDNVQMILVGLNDTHVRLALADKRIGFVIPWHASGSSEDVLRTLMDSNNEKLVKGTDYTPVQDDKVIDYGDKKLNAKMKAMRKLREDIVMAKLKKGVTDEQQALLDENKWLQDLYNRYYVDESAEEYGVKLSGKQAEKIFPYEYWDKSLTLKDADQNGYRFQEYCASLGLKPRFSGAVVNGEMIGDFTNDPGYWKLLIDRSMYNNDGTYHEPQVIDVTKIKISQIPMTVNSNLYRDDTKLKQATMDSLRALDQQPNDVSMTMDVGGSEISEDVVMAEEAVQNSTSLNLKDLTPEEKERFAQYRKQYQDRLRARREDRKARQDLLKRANKAVRLAKNRPGYAAEAIKDLVKDLDLVSVGIRSNTKDNLTKKYFEILQMRQDDPNYAALHSEKDMQRVERLFKKQIKDMDLDDVKDLITELSALIHYQETQNKLFKDSKGRDAAEAGRQWVKELNELKPLDITNGVKQLGAKYLRNNLSPERAARMISGYKRGSVAQELVRNLEDGLTTQLAFEQKADELFRPFLENKSNRDFVKNASKQNIEIADADGNKAMISPAMRVALYMHSRNRDNLVHIADGGLKIPNPKLYEQGKIKDAYNRGRKLKLQPTDIQAIIADMTPQEQEYAQLLTTFFDDYSKDAINETSLTLDGIYRAIVDKYFPITSDPDFLAKSMDLVNDPTLEGWGNLKARQEGSVNPILLEDATKVLQRHIKKTGQYAGLAIPLRDFQKVYGYVSSGQESSVQKAIGNAWDQDTKDYLTQFIKDLNTGGRQAERGIAEKVRSLYAGSVLTLNPSVALKQTTSYSMAGSILESGSLLYGLTHRFTKADRDYMDSITPWGWARRQGQSTIEIGDLAKRKKGLEDNIPNWNQAMDVLTTDKLFLATEDSIKKEYPNLKRGDKEYDEALAEKYNQVLWRTQPQYEAMFRPEYLRKTDIGSRTFGMFKTESMQMSGELIDAWGQWRADKKRAKNGDAQARKDSADSAKHFYKTLTSWAVSNALFALVGAAISIGLMHKPKKYRDEKGELSPEAIATQVVKDFVSSSFGGGFGLGNVYDVGQYLYDIVNNGNGNWYDIEAPGFSLINDLINNGGNMIGTITNEEANAEAKRKAIAKFALSVSKFTPIGFAENIYNMLNSVNLYIQDGVQGTLGRYEAGKGLLADTSPDKGQYANMAVNAAQNGDFKTVERALKKTNKEQLAKALGGKISERLFERFMSNPENLAAYINAMGEGGISISDVPDAGYPSFLKLRQALGDPERTQNWHHIVEQEQGPGDKYFGTFKAGQINNVNNIVSIPSGTKSPHGAISQYYGSVQDFTGGKTVREWLRDKSFEEQWEFGVEQLKKYGDLIPTDKGWVYIPDDEKIEQMMPLSEGSGEGPVDTSKYGDISMEAATVFQEKKIEAGEDGSTTKSEIHDIIVGMINDGILDINNAETLYSSQLKGKPKENFDAFADKYDDVESYFGVIDAKSANKQDGVIDYLKNSSLTEEEKQMLWELAAGYKPSVYEKKMGY